MDQQLFEVFDKPKRNITSLLRMDALMELENMKQQRVKQSQEQPQMESQDQMNLDMPQESQASAEFNAPNQKFRVSQKFGNYNPGLYAGRTKGSKHYGVDIAAPKGTQVYAPISGEVIPGEDRTFGKYVRVLGDDGIVYQFSHLSGSIKGGRVKQGQPIAQTGNSGYSTGAHLDIMAKKDNNYIDPLTLQNIQKLWL